MIRSHIFIIFAQCSEYGLAKDSLSSDLVYLDFLFLVQVAIIKTMILRPSGHTVTQNLQSRVILQKQALDLLPRIHQRCILRWTLRCKEIHDFPKDTRQGNGGARTQFTFLFSLQLSCSFYNSPWLLLEGLLGNMKHGKYSSMYLPPLQLSFSYFAKS